MRRMRVYISGPITGMPDHNNLAFNNAKGHVEALGHIAIVPLTIAPWDHEGPCPKSYAAGQTSEHTAACYLRGDLIAMLGDCDALFMLGGWESSIGARLEHNVASHCGMTIYYEFGLVPLPPGAPQLKPMDRWVRKP